MDTPEEFAAQVAKYHADLTPDERWQIASGMFDTARAIIVSSLSPELSSAEQALAVVRRLHAGELPEAALQAVVIAHTWSV